MNLSFSASLVLLNQVMNASDAAHNSLCASVDDLTGLCSLEIFCKKIESLETKKALLVVGIGTTEGFQKTSEKIDHVLKNKTELK